MTGTYREIGPATLPLAVSGVEIQAKLYYYDFGAEGRWIAVIAGDISNGEPVPLRIESACVFGHIFHSVKCDCGFQLDEAMKHIGKLRRGLVIYGLDQDARGLGVASHFQIYVLRQQENLDTEEVYRRLDAPVDARTYDPVAHILRRWGVREVGLLSNNLGRQEFLKANGFAVKRIPLEAPLTEHNMATLMLEKEDLAYEWSFRTHADWLRPVQSRVEDDPGTSAGAIVLNNQEMETELVDTDWSLARGLAARVGALPDGARRVVYLSDFPRRDELPVYAQIGVSFIVVPFAVIPEDLAAEAAACGVRLQDWERENRYKEPRPQWSYTGRVAGVDAYVRGDRLRVVAVESAAFDRVRRRYRANEASDQVLEVTAGADHWFEVRQAPASKLTLLKAFEAALQDGDRTPASKSYDESRLP